MMEGYIKTLLKAASVLMLILSISYTVHFKSIAIKDMEEHNFKQNTTTVKRLYVRKVWNDNLDSIKSLNRHSSNDMSAIYNNPNFVKFASDTIDFFQVLPSIKVNLYDAQGRLFLTNNEHNVINSELDTSSGDFLSIMWKKLLAVISTEEDDRLAISTALSGLPYSRILKSATFQVADNITQNAIVAQVLIPIYSNVGGSRDITGVLEVFYDISEEWHDLNLFQNVSIVGILVLFLLFYALLSYTSVSAQTLIAKQHETNQELIAAKARAEAESENKSKFLANITHELRTPLNAIIGFSDIIKNESMGPIGNEQYKEYINDIHNSGAHLLALINDLLDYSKAESDKLVMDSIEVDVSKILSSSLRLVKPRAEESHVTLIDAVPVEQLIIKADPKRLKQAVLNLLSNSVKFTPEGGSVTVSAAVEGESLIIKVKDTGIGMSEKDIPKALSIFGQIDSKLSRKYEGSGLGLPLTKKLIELMGGVFDIKSELGFGTTVTFTFPYKKEEEVKKPQITIT